MQYELDDQHSVVKESQLLLFESDDTISATNSDIQNERGYTVNDKTETLTDSKTQALGFFSGAGGLDIGAQLAGVKIISSLDFDKDSVDTMKTNAFFNHTKHFLEDIKNVTAKKFRKKNLR